MHLPWYWFSLLTRIMIKLGQCWPKARTSPQPIEFEQNTSLRGWDKRNLLYFGTCIMWSISRKVSIKPFQVYARCEGDISHWKKSLLFCVCSVWLSVRVLTMVVNKEKIWYILLKDPYVLNILYPFTGFFLSQSCQIFKLTLTSNLTIVILLTIILYVILK